MQQFAVVLPDPVALAAKGFAHASHLPVIFKDGGTKYDRDSNEFLYERCLGYWPPSVDGQSPPVTPKSQRTYGYALADFLTYAAKRAIDLTKADYVMHIYGRYQPEMLAGTWSASGRPLSPNTVNPRVDRACEYLAWLAFKGRRQHFVVPTRDVDVSISSPNSTRSDVQTVRARKGRARSRRSDLQLPTDEELGRWLADVERRHGPTLALAFELILQTAIRKAELVGWRVDTIPRDPSRWVIVNPTARPEDQNISVSIRFGTKGGNFGVDGSDKIGPERDILVPLTLARRLHEYRENSRRRSLMKLKVQHKGTELAKRMGDPHLFLDERSGEPVDYDRVTNCWRNVEALPFGGWSPHGGRHWWACMKLWRSLKMREAELKSRGEMAGEALISMATDIIRLEIKDQLGHVDLATTHRYIRWVARQLSVALPTTYAKYMQAADDAADDAEDH
jgi:integrase